MSRTLTKEWVREHLARRVPEGDGSGPRGSGVAVPYPDCPVCGAEMARWERVEVTRYEMVKRRWCPSCGYEFPEVVRYVR
jgi:predicted RNA-binding Zn-ribbon protein involved in translation (DUF1610 family)